MAIQEFILEHLRVFANPPTSGFGEPTDLNNHQPQSGLSAFDYWFVMGYSAATRRWVLSNDGRALINAPLRVSIIGASSAIANTTTATVFSKSATLVAGAANVLGAAVRVRAFGKYSTKASTPGNMSCEILIGTRPLLFSFLSPEASITNQAWSAEVEGIVHVTGSSGQLLCGSGRFAMYDAVVTPAKHRPNGLVDPTNTIDLTGAVTIQVRWTHQTADASNSAVMTGATIDIAYPGATVS